MITLLIFQLDISGKDFKEEQPLNNPLKSVVLFKFHLDISGKDIKEEQSSNIKLKLVTFKTIFLSKLLNTLIIKLYSSDKLLE